MKESPLIEVPQGFKHASMEFLSLKMQGLSNGANRFRNIDVNAKLQKSSRRIPFHNMIYIADGPSDVPAFSIVKQNGGRTLQFIQRGRHNL